MSVTKKISIIVPCYKVEKYLPRCLDSLMNQTLEDIEAICINDGSPDRCIDILRDYENRYPGKIVIIDKENEGVWRGRRDAIAIAKGEFIGFLDSDDYAEPDFCEKLYTAAREAQADMAVCGYMREDAETGECLNIEMVKYCRPYNVADTPQRLIEMNGAPWNKIFKAELLRDLPDLSKPPKIYDDMMMELLIFTRVTRVVFTSHALIHYMVRSDSIMTSITDEHIDGTYAAMLEVKQVYKREHMPQAMMEFLDAAAFLHMGVSLMFYISCDPKTDLSAQLKRNRSYLDKNFPTWNSGKVISAAHVARFGKAFGKIELSKLIYKTHLMKPALSVYRKMIASGTDVKW